MKGRNRHRKTVEGYGIILPKRVIQTGESEGCESDSEYLHKTHASAYIRLPDLRQIMIPGHAADLKP